MKQKFLTKWSSFVVAMTLALVGCIKYDDRPLWEKVNEMDSRLTNLEQTVSRLNSDVNSFQTLMKSLQDNVYVTGMTETPNGYVLTFNNGQQITIKNGQDGQTPRIGENGNWWIGDTDTGVKAKGDDGQTPRIGNNGNWWIGNTDTGVNAKGEDGETPRIGNNGNWWIGNTDTGVKAKGEDGKNGLTPYVGDNGNWWIGTTDTGKQAIGRDGITPHIGENGNWWIDTTDTGVKAKGEDGETPRIGENGNWWIGDTDTGIQVVSTEVNVTNVPIIGVDIYEGIYYWTVTINGETTWLLSKDDKMLPVSGYAPIFQVDYQGYLIYTVDNGMTWLYIYDYNGNPVPSSSEGQCACTQFFKNVYVSGDYLILILIDGSEIKIRINGSDDNVFRDRFFEVEGGYFNEEEIPSSTSGNVIEEITYNQSVLSGGMNFITVISRYKYIKFYIGIKGFHGHWVYIPASHTFSGGKYTYIIPLLFSVNYHEDITFIIIAEQDDGSMTQGTEGDIKYVESMSGDLNINLTFDTPKDVDLHLILPNNERIYYNHRGGTYTTSEGQTVTYGLDHDSNAGCRIDNLNNENIYIPAELITTGTYTIIVDLYQNCNTSYATNWSVVARYKGNLIRNDLGQNPVSGTYPANSGAGDKTEVIKFTLTENDVRRTTRAAFCPVKFEPIPSSDIDELKDYELSLRNNY